MHAILFFAGFRVSDRITILRDEFANEDSIDDDMIVCLHSLCAHGSIDESVGEKRRQPKHFVSAMLLLQE
jgi:hypothetical protein